MSLVEYVNETRKAVHLIDCGLGLGKWALCRTNRSARALTGKEGPRDATHRTTHYDPRSDHGLRDVRDSTRPAFQHPARGNLHHYGRQRLWQEYAAAPSHRPHATRHRRGAV